MRFLAFPSRRRGVVNVLPHVSSRIAKTVGDRHLDATKYLQLARVRHMGTGARSAQFAPSAEG